MDSRRNAKSAVSAQLRKIFLSLFKDNNSIALQNSQLANLFSITLFDSSPQCLGMLVIRLEGKIENLSPEQKRHFIGRLNKFPSIHNFLLNVITQLKGDQWLKAFSQSALVPILNYLNTETIEEEVAAYIERKYSSIDTRRQIESLPVRRMDSLARLFDLNSILSVCNAVAIHRGEIIVSYNVSGKDAHHEIFLAARSRFKALENHFQKIVKNWDQRQYTLMGQEVNLALYRELMQPVPSKLPQAALMRALDKVSDTICFERMDKSLSLINQLFKSGNTRFRVLMPFLDSEKHFYILDAQDEFEKAEKHFINCAGMHSSVSHYHAEQVLVKYIFDVKKASEYTAENKLLVGVTKLPCPTCAPNLACRHVIARGCHGNYDEKTVSLIEDGLMSALEKSIRSAMPTMAFDSPHNSTQKRREMRTELHRSETTSSTSTVKRRLVFDDLDVEETVETKTIKQSEEDITISMSERMSDSFEVTVKTNKSVTSSTIVETTILSSSQSYPRLFSGSPAKTAAVIVPEIDDVFYSGSESDSESFEDVVPQKETPKSNWRCSIQ